MDWIQSIFRWLHVVAGIAWIGHLYFFNFVNSQVAKTYDADSKKKVVPELMPRALYFFRMGAAWTWITGFVLLLLVYYHAQIMPRASNTVVTAPFAAPVELSNMAATLIALGIIVIIFFLYDALWKMVKNEKAGTVISFIAIAIIVWGTSQIFEHRAVWIHLGAFFGTIMMMNVWMRIWPAQRKIIAGIKGDAPAPDASVPAMAGLRSKHNTYMSVPLIFTMISNHYPTIFAEKFGWLYLLGLVLLGWLLTRWLYIKAASAAPAKF
jgi:uncharacterized membrane protein